MRDWGTVDGVGALLGAITPASAGHAHDRRPSTIKTGYHAEAVARQWEQATGNRSTGSCGGERAPAEGHDRLATKSGQYDI